MHKNLLDSKNKTLFYSINVSFMGRRTAHIFKEVPANTFHSCMCFRYVFVAPDVIFLIKTRSLQHSNAVAVKLKNNPALHWQVVSLPCAQRYHNKDLINRE